MGERIPRSYSYAVVLLILAIGVVLAWRYLGTKNDLAGIAGAPEQNAKETEERDRRIRDLGNEVSQLRKELEESSNKVAELQNRLEQTTKALSSTEQKLRSAIRQAERPAVAPAQPREKTAAKPAEPAPPPSPRRAAEPGSYEIIRPTSVFAEPSDSSRKLSTINRGTRVTVVGSEGEWLEVRSKHGNPPGFIRRDDAMFVDRQN